MAYSKFSARHARTYNNLIRLLSSKKQRTYSPSLLSLDELLMLSRRWSALHRMSFHFDVDTQRAWARATQWLAASQEIVRPWLGEIQRHAPHFFEVLGDDHGASVGSEEDAVRVFEKYVAVTTLEADRLIPDEMRWNLKEERSDELDKVQVLVQLGDSDDEVDDSVKCVDQLCRDSAGADESDDDGDWRANEIVVGGFSDSEEEKEEEEEEVEVKWEVVHASAGSAAIDDDSPVEADEPLKEDEEQEACLAVVEVERSMEVGEVLHEDDQRMAPEAPVIADDSESMEVDVEPEEVKTPKIQKPHVETIEIVVVNTSTATETMDVDEQESPAGTGADDAGNEEKVEELVEEPVETNQDIHSKPIDLRVNEPVDLTVDEENHSNVEVDASPVTHTAVDTDVLDASEILCGISNTRLEHDEDWAAAAATLAVFKTQPRVSSKYKLRRCAKSIMSISGADGSLPKRRQSQAPGARRLRVTPRHQETLAPPPQALRSLAPKLGYAPATSGTANLPHPPLAPRPPAVPGLTGMNPPSGAWNYTAQDQQGPLRHPLAGMSPEQIYGMGILPTHVLRVA